MKRFWTDVSVLAADGGRIVQLDGRELKTPMRRRLLVPNNEMADAVAKEWRDCEDILDPAKMPMTGFANAAVDRVADNRQSFVDAVAAFGETDLFCYRADGQEELALRQEKCWGRWVRWAEREFGIRLEVVAGITHKPQETATISSFHRAVSGFNDFELAAGTKITHIGGSLIALLALKERVAEADEIWPDLVLDELWQEQQWGGDHWAEKNRNDRREEFVVAATFLKLAAG